MGELRERFDWVICDSPAGIERGATLAMRHADIAVVVTNPEVSSVRDSDRIIGLLDSKTAKAEKGEQIDKHLLLTRYDPARAERGEMLKTEDVLEILSIPLLGIIPESEEVLRASNVGSPITIANPLSAAGARLRRRRAAARRRDRRRSPFRPTGGACSASCSRGGPHEPVQLFFRKQPTAPVARDRLQILLSHERTIAGGSDLVALLREEILAVIKKHVHGRSRKGAGQDGPRRIGVDARGRHRDPDADEEDDRAEAEGCDGERPLRRSLDGLRLHGARPHPLEGGGACARHGLVS